MLSTIKEYLNILVELFEQPEQDQYHKPQIKTGYSLLIAFEKRNVFINKNNLSLLLLIEVNLRI